ncbi:uncharacterized protein B0H64DRAFT_134666 [Chaetomium fimeti]|uniref:Uncharacterized protein n=1 Tax=Chaetomium fimeti TaxID=1854472 RepID=A0AAE0HK18_9PEZI|nr:hypothetical protein B0H64DRAFT_134666 [Chaetomium fimeti]
MIVCDGGEQAKPAAPRTWLPRFCCGLAGFVTQPVGAPLVSGPMDETVCASRPSMVDPMAGNPTGPWCRMPPCFEFLGEGGGFEWPRLQFVLSTVEKLGMLVW